MRLRVIETRQAAAHRGASATFVADGDTAPADQAALMALPFIAEHQAKAPGGFVRWSKSDAYLVAEGNTGFTVVAHVDGAPLDLPAFTPSEAQ